MSETQDQKPPPETVRRVLDAFLIFGPEDILIQLDACEPSSPLAAAFIKNACDGLRRVTSAGTLPYHLMVHSVHQRNFDRFHAAERIRSLKHVESGEEPSPEADQRAFEIASEKVRAFAQSDEGTRHFRDRIVYDLDRRLSSSSVMEAAAELLVQSLISAWAVFESSVRAFIIEWINADPKRANPVLASTNLKSYFGKQVVDIDVIGEHHFDLTTSMGDILFRERRLDNLSVIRSVLEALFNDPEVRDSLGDDMWLLNQRRHLFVHRRGLVDAEYLKRTGDSVPLGQRLAIKSDDVEHYIRAVQRAFMTIAWAAEGGR